MPVFEIPKTMKAAVYRGRNDLRIETVPVPRIRADELLVKVAVCGICPTDIKKIQAGALPPPRIFGHETAGTIVRVGAKVGGFKAGDRVGLHHHIPCRKCHFCRHHAYAQCPQYKQTGITAGFEPSGGGFAEYVRVMGFVLPGVVKIPRHADFIHGALLEPVNTVLKGIQMLNLHAGDTVAVMGQGPIGLLFTRILSQKGMVVLATDLIDERRAFAAHHGASWVGAPDELETVRSHRGRLLSSPESESSKRRPIVVDAAVVTVPVDAAVLQAHELVRGAGTVLIFGHTQKGKTLPIDPGMVCVDEKTLMGSYSSDVRLQKKSARYCFSDKEFLNKLVTDWVPVEQAAAGIQLAACPQADHLKIAVSMG